MPVGRGFSRPRRTQKKAEVSAVIATILSILLALYILQSLAKFVIHFTLPYEVRIKRISAEYEQGGRLIHSIDAIVLGLCALLVVLLLLSDRTETLSFTTGLVVGMTLIQTYFHRFRVPLPPERAPESPPPPIKLMSFAIQDNPRRAWLEYLFMTILLVGALLAIIAEWFGWSL